MYKLLYIPNISLLCFLKSIMKLTSSMPKSRDKKNIIIKGAKVNNLKNVSLIIPRDKLIVITGLSGSGKSSLAFDTLYAEGQRRYVESLSAYSRQFLGKINKPDVDNIKGIPPAIAIQQKVKTSNQRSTIGTSTEIYDYLKLLYARIGKTYSPISGDEVKCHSVKDVSDYVLSLNIGLAFYILAPITIEKNKSFFETIEIIQQQGFSRVEVNNEIYRVKDLFKGNIEITPSSVLKIVIDRLTVKNDDSFKSRLGDSIETAFFEGKGNCEIKIKLDNKNIAKHFSNNFEADGITFLVPNTHFFSFNNPLGACALCEGYGSTIGIDEELVVPNKNLSVYEDAITCWRGDKMKLWKEKLIFNAEKFDFPIHRPFFDLTEKEKLLIWTGNEYFEGLNTFFKYLEKEKFKIQFRVMLSRYQGKTTCPKCKGTRLRKDTEYVKVDGKSIQDLIMMNLKDLHSFFKNINLSEFDNSIAKRLLVEIDSRLEFLLDVGLPYLNLNRKSSTLSGGESQRINLVTSLGSSLVGALYILDEPSIGLHSRDTFKLINVLKKLRDTGNTVIVVEHDEEIIKAADEIIDIGPEAGRLGGEVVFQGSLDELYSNTKSLTAKYLNGELNIEIPNARRKWNNFIEIVGARANNLKGINVKIPLNCLTVVSGVSGSGKSSLVKNILFPELTKIQDSYQDINDTSASIKGDTHLLSNVEFVDQKPIGRSSRSNPVTYIKAYDDIRKLFTEQKLSKYNGFKPSHFSFNIDGGRCETCLGEGTIKVEMQFMADVFLICETCKGKRFKEAILDVKYKNHNIYDILELTVEEAITLFSKGNSSVEKRICAKLKPLIDVGLGYVKLGQSSSTLSGGESQRVKLASFLIKENSPATLFIFDEPTTGLHFHDIKKLLNSFYALLDKGHSIVVIEHNTDVIKSADWIIDLGPEGGEFGGNVVFEGTPEDILKCKKSLTGKYFNGQL